MPVLRYKYWDSDAVGVRKAIVGNREYVFEKGKAGLCLVPKDDATLLLRNGTNYEVAQWCDHCESIPSGSPTVSEDQPVVPSVPKPRGRPRKA